jgi:hypothetical protein
VVIVWCFLALPKWSWVNAVVGAQALADNTVLLNNLGIKGFLDEPVFMTLRSFVTAPACVSTKKSKEWVKDHVLQLHQDRHHILNVEALDKKINQAATSITPS